MTRRGKKCHPYARINAPNKEQELDQAKHEQQGPTKGKDRQSQKWEY